MCPYITNALEDLRNLNTEDLFEEQWNVLAPCTETLEKEDVEEGSKISNEFISLRADSDMIAQSGGDSSNTTGEVMANYMDENEYLSLIQSLNKEQRMFFCHVVHHFRTSDTPLYCFLSGGAGVGKTVVVHALYQALVRYFNKQPGSNPDDLKVLLAAPTGKAAFLFKGNTLHTLFQIPACQGFTYKPLKSDRLNSLRCKFQYVKLIIIDEISMVGNGMLNFINQRLQQITGSQKSFGGISILTVGDLYQLKPVFDGWMFENLNKDYGPLASNLWKEHFQMFTLSQIMRQKESAEFAALLNRLREQKHTEEDIKKLNARKITPDESGTDYPLYIPHIFLQNKKVNAFNNQIYELSNERKIHVKASDYIIGDVDAEIKEKVRKSIPVDTSKTMGLSKDLNLSIGMQCEVSVNVDVEDGISNGSSCVLMGASRLSKTANDYDVMWVKFDDVSIGKKCRAEGKRLYTKNIEKQWTPITTVKRAFMVGRYKSVQVVREQFPLRSSAAKTCHRCQGDTMESAVVDFTGSCFPHCHYVALSRVKNIENLYIRELNEKKIHIDKRVQKEMDRLNQTMKLTTRYESIQEAVSNSFMMYFQNVRSFRKHFKNIYQDSTIVEADLLLFVETKLSGRDENELFLMPDYEVHRFDNEDSRSRSPYGIILYSKEGTCEIHEKYHKITKQGKEMVESVVVNVQANVSSRPLCVHVLYSSPKTSLKTLQHHIERTRTLVKSNLTEIILGDFNIDLLSNPNHQFLHFMHQYIQHIKETTTDYNSLLDHVYSRNNQGVLNCFVLESVFSDHKPLLISIK
ncbi:hypothetical protein FSP39_008803 [Pinctada imbricata]|uniref:ATP-dependent DNA helicase n=1 Tax=Pinctada imbricata TaxID=66713 RepID=A0AA89BZ63_PINIB|nr:hypothetical protein FSP39_008803 [Pinctada imbricata]